jgi:transcriptional regulator with XRE-family HTH domain
MRTGTKAIDPIVSFLKRKREETGLGIDALCNGYYVANDPDHRRFPSAPSVRDWETGEHSPKLCRLREYARVLGYEICLRKIP